MLMNFTAKVSVFLSVVLSPSLSLANAIACRHVSTSSAGLYSKYRMIINIHNNTTYIIIIIVLLNYTLLHNT